MLFYYFAFLEHIFSISSLGTVWNSSKSNITPDEESIAKLKERNAKLQQEMHKDLANKKNSILQEFDYAIEHDYLDKFYKGCCGC